MNTFIYSVYYYFDDEKRLDNGALNANTYTDAMTILESYYGDDICEISFLAAYDSPVLLIPDEALSTIIDAQM